MSDELPEGWVMTTLGEVASPSGNKTEPTDSPEAPYLSLEHIESDTNRILGRGKGRDVNSTKAVFRAEDVLYGKLRPYLNKVCIPDFDGICSTDILVFPRRPWLENRFLMRFLSQRSVVEYANHHSAGVQLPRVHFSKLAELDFPLPPLAEQVRIIAKVEELLVRVNAARERLSRVPAILKRFRQSVLAAACSGRLTVDWRVEHVGPEPASVLLTRLRNGRKSSVARESDGAPELPESWTWATPEGMATEIVDCPHSTPRWADTGRICLRTTNFRPGLLDLSEVRYVSEATYQQRIARLEPKAGDVVYSREGGILGVACMVPPGVTSCLGQRMMLFRIHPECCPEYFMHVLNSPFTIKRVQELTGGTASPHLNVGDIRQFPVPLPPSCEQREIVRRVEALFALADAIENRVAAATARVEKLTQAILARAFRGELVPTEAELARREGRDYEPASALLERIRAERPSRAHRERRRSGRGGVR